MRDDTKGPVLEPLKNTFSVCKVRDYAGVEIDRPFVFIGRTDEEKSLVCPTDQVPADTLAREDGWRAFRICGELDFSLIGILSRISAILADNKIGIFAVSTYNTDYILTKSENFERALKALGDAGYRIKEEPGALEKSGEHGTAKLWTDRLVLRRYVPEDADPLYRNLGMDPVMYQYSGWNPYGTPEMAQETVRRFIDSYQDARFYGWVIEDRNGVLVGTIGAYDCREDRIEVGLSIVKDRWGQGYATEALQKVLAYLTENEGISCVTAWCAAENTGSRKAMEKAGMERTGTEKDGLAVGGKTYDRLTYEYKG